MYSYQQVGPDASEAKEYELTILPDMTGADDTAELSFDMFNLDPVNDPDAWVYLEEVAIDEAVITPGSTVVTYTFDTGMEGWTFEGTVNPFDEPVVSVEAGRIGLSPAGSTNAFSYWYSPEITIEQGKLYRARMTVGLILPIPLKQLISVCEPCSPISGVHGPAARSSAGRLCILPAAIHVPLISYCTRMLTQQPAQSSSRSTL